MCKDRIKKFLKTCMVIMMAVCIMQTMDPVYAKEKEEVNSKDIFNDGVDELIEKAREMPVYSDKEMSSDGIEKTNPQKRVLKKGKKSKYKIVGNYPKRSGVIMVTSDAYKDLIPTGHAAIIYMERVVIESLSNGVQKGKNDWEKSKKECYGVAVMGATYQQAARVANWCRDQIGKKYNFNYLNVKTRNKFYCSQLVWAGFKDVYGIDLNTDAFGAAIHPMELVHSPKTYIIYKKVENKKK